MAPNSTKNGSRMGSGLEDPRILIAVDFGTTYSAVAWANTYEPETQNLMKDWGKGLIGEKVPTILQYKNDEIRWGFEVLDLGSDEKFHEWFKLGLCPEVEDKRNTEASLLRDYPSKTALPTVRGKKCRKMVVDYLKKVKEATEKDLKQESFDKVYKLPREYIITVPAMWSEEAQDATRACAAEAFLGERDRIDEIQIVAEPEAAGIYALAEMPKLGLEEGDTFVICDAGGGTVDLSSYKVNKLGQYRDLERVSILAGDLCGSSLLNRIFEAYLEKKLGIQLEQWGEARQRWFKSVVKNDFEKRIKPQFTGEEGADYNYRIDAFGFPDNTNQGIKKESLQIPAREIRTEVFDKVISKIKALVLEQVIATGNVKEVLLAGGFGQNEYLKIQLQTAVGNTVIVRKIKDSRTAIVRGALIAGLTEEGLLEKRRRPGKPQQQDHGRIYPRVVSRPAPKHYGVLVIEEFDRSNKIHWKGRERKVPGFKGGPEMIERINWFVKMDEKIPDEEPKSFPLSWEKESLPGGTRPKTFPCQVFSSNAKDPPLFRDIPKFPCHPPAKLLLTLDIDLDKIPNWKPELRDDNRSYWFVNFDVYMKLHSAKLSFFLGREEETYKPKSVTYDSQRS